MSPHPHDGLVEGDADVVDGLAVDLDAGPAELGPATVPAPALTPARLPATQAAVVAVTGFAAGAVTAAVVGGVSRRRAVKAAKRPARKGLPVVGSRSFLVDVHLLGGRD